MNSSDTGTEPISVVVDDLVIDFTSGIVSNRFTGQVKCTLGYNEVMLLKILCVNYSRLVTRESISSYIWADRYVSPASTNKSVSLLRAALDDSVKPYSKILTVSGRGYKLVASHFSLIGTERELNTPPVTPKWDLVDRLKIFLEILVWVTLVILFVSNFLPELFSPPYLGK